MTRPEVAFLLLSIIASGTAITIFLTGRPAPALPIGAIGIVLAFVAAWVAVNGR